MDKSQIVQRNKDNEFVFLFVFLFFSNPFLKSTKSNNEEHLVELECNECKQEWHIPYDEMYREKQVELGNMSMQIGYQVVKSHVRVHISIDSHVVM